MKKMMFLLASGLLFALPVMAHQKLVFSTINGLSMVPAGEQLLKDAYAQLNIEIRIKEYPGERSLVMANTAKTDGELGRIAGMEKQFPNLVMVPVPLMHLSVSAYSNQNIFVTSFSDLKKYRIGFVAGTKIVENFTDGFPNRLGVSRPDQLFEMLLLGRIDVAIDMTEDGLIVLQVAKYKTIKAVSPALAEGDIYHYLNKKHADLVPKITKVLQEMSDQGVIKKRQEEFLAKIKQPSVQ